MNAPYRCSEKYFHKGAIINACMKSPFLSISKTLVLGSNSNSMSSVLSKCWLLIGSTPFAKKQWQRLFVVLGLGEMVMSLLHAPPPKPVSSCSSRLAASSGSSSFSITPAQISFDTMPSPCRHWRSIIKFPLQSSAITFTQSGYSST